MTRRKPHWTPTPRAAADRARTRRALAVMGGTVVLLAALLFAAWQPRRKEPAEAEHPHQAAPHGGTVVVLGVGESHSHAEVVVEKGGLLKLYTFGEDLDRVQEVEARPLAARVHPEGRDRSVAVSLRPLPQAADARGRASRFVGMLPEDLWGQRLVVTVPDLVVGGRQVRLEASGCRPIDPPGHGRDTEELYLRPGGRYTAADVRANGNTAPRKFKGFRTTHDLNPRPGDRVCPVTRAKADARCAWVVGGETYLFCCPPCVDEFVSMAKVRPEEVREARAYVQE